MDLIRLKSKWRLERSILYVSEQIAGKGGWSI
jgi:hypothetical protein